MYVQAICKSQNCRKSGALQRAVQGSNEMKKSMKRSFFGATALGVLCSGAGVAHAQSESESADAGRNIIIVTARKSEENILEVPLAVTAISGEELAAQGLDNITDLASVTPGLTFEDFVTFPSRQDSSPFIRGVVLDQGFPDPTIQPVGVFIDGIFVSGGTKNLGIEDIQRVEVIKGPQSATFGRATFSGAINYVTVDPANEFGGKISLSAATRDEYEATAVLEGPIIGDVVTARLSGRYKFDGGHYANSANPGEMLGEQKTWSIGGTVLIQPSDALRVKIRGFFSRIDDGPAAVTQFDGSFNNFGPFGDGDESIFSGTLPNPNTLGSRIGLNTNDRVLGLVRDAAVAANYDFIRGDGLDQGFGLIVDSGRASIDAQYDIPDTDVTINAIFGYNKETSLGIYDADNSPDERFVNISPASFEDYTAELRVSGKAFGDRLTYSIGANYFESEFTNNFDFIILQDEPGDGIGFFRYNLQNPAFSARTFGAEDGVTSRRPRNYGLFGQLGYEFSDQFAINLEGRYQIDRILTGNIDTMGVFAPITGAPETFKNFLPRASLEYTPTENTLLYATYSEGNLPGGFNTVFGNLNQLQLDALAAGPFSGVQPAYGEETLKNYELGWKQSAFDNRLTFSLAAFYMERSDEVVNVTIEYPNPDGVGTRTNGANINAQSSEIYGMELEADFVVNENFKLHGTLAYIKAEVTDFPDFAESVGDVRDILGSGATSVGQQAPRFPDWAGSLSATMTQPDVVTFSGTSMDFYTRADYYYTGRRFLTLVNVGKTPPAHDVNLRMGLDSENFNIEFFVTNVLNESGPTAANNASDLSFTSTPFSVEAVQIGLRDKRQFGIRTTFDF